MKIFTYGTFRQNCVRHHVFQHSGAKKLYDDLVCAKMFTLNRLWPFIIISPEIFSVVTGEVYEIANKYLPELDRIEGYKKDNPNNLFERIQVKTLHEKELVSIYIGGKCLINDISKAKSIEYGDWLAYYLMLKGYQCNTKAQQEIIKNFLKKQV